MGRLQHPNRHHPRHHPAPNPQAGKTQSTRKKTTEVDLFFHSHGDSYPVRLPLPTLPKMTNKSESTAGIYGVWETRTAEADDPFYHEAAFLMMTDVEIFMYAVGASLPGSSHVPPYPLSLNLKNPL